MKEHLIFAAVPLVIIGGGTILKSLLTGSVGKGRTS
jgi:hypothetical protein